MNARSRVHFHLGTVEFQRIRGKGYRRLAQGNLGRSPLKRCSDVRFWRITIYRVRPKVLYKRTAIFTFYRENKLKPWGMKFLRWSRRFRDNRFRVKNQYIYIYIYTNTRNI